MKYIPHLFIQTCNFFIAVNPFLFMNACSEDMTGKQGNDPFVEFSFIQSPVETREVIGEDGGAYTEANVPGSYLPIQCIDICGIGQDVWEEYFRTHPDK